MNQQQIKLVQDSFTKVVPIADTAAEIFYARLFELDPKLKPMFKGDMKEQGKKLMAMIGTAVGSLNNLEAVVPAVQDLGKKHVNYGVQPEHYDTVGEALLYTLGKGLGDDFTPDVSNAWTETYTILATTMKDAAYKPKEEEVTEKKPWYKIW